MTKRKNDSKGVELFSEIYSIYYDVIAQAIQWAVHNPDHALTEAQLAHLISTDDHFFGRDIQGDLKELLTGSSGIFDHQRRTNLLTAPYLPVTTLERRWLKTMLQDPRMKLFDVPETGLEDVEPLYDLRDICVLDATGESDPWDDVAYQQVFRTILAAIKTGNHLHICWQCRENLECVTNCIPQRLQYSMSDDKFRLIATVDKDLTINLSRITSCSVISSDEPLCFVYPNELEISPPKANAFLEESQNRLQASKKQHGAQGNAIEDDTVGHELTMVVVDRRDAMERVMTDFALFKKKEIVKLNGDEQPGCYRVVLIYGHDDLHEIIRRVLSYGPRVQVLAPDEVRNIICDRLRAQGQRLKHH